MALQENILDVSKLCFDGDFEAQTSHIFKSIRLSRNEVEGFSLLFQDLQTTLSKVWPGCNVMPFGSIITGLGIKTSDVDCYVELPNWYKNPGDKFVVKAKHTLARKPMLFRELFAITSAKIPIVKFYHVPTSRHCDVSFKSCLGVRNSKLIGYLLHIDERALPLTILVKYWSKVHKLTGTNLMPNYTLTMLVIFYLQQKNITTPVSVLQRSTENDIVDNWNTAFMETLDYTRTNNESLYQLLGDFFKYYSSFDFNVNVVCPYLGYAIKRNTFKDTNNVPADFNIYKNNVKENKCLPLKIDTGFCVQDPFEHNRNCAVGVHPRLAVKIVSYIKFAANMYDQETENCFLRAILTKTPASGNGVANTNRSAPHGVTKNKKQKQRMKMKGNLQQNLHALYEKINSMKRDKT